MAENRGTKGLKHIHYICVPEKHGRPAVHLSGSIYETGDWKGSQSEPEEQAQRLVGGFIFLHLRRAAPAYFIGRVISYHIKHDTVDGKDKIVYIVDVGGLLPETDVSSRINWCGKDIGRAWESGVQDGDHGVTQ